MEALRYLGEVSLYWLLLYGCYGLLLRRHTFFGWNRAYLLGSLLGAFVLPLLQYPEAAPVMPPVAYVVATVPAVVISPAAESTTSLPPWTQWVWAVYALGVVGRGTLLYRQLRQLFMFIRRGETLKLEGYTLVLLDSSAVGSFSFLHWVVISRRDYEQHFDTILSHELVHVRQRHSLDVLLVEVLRVLFWFNPILLFYKKSLQEVHEYLADREATHRDRYAGFLLSYALGAPVATLTNHFFTSSLLKDRIKMLYKNRDSRWSLGKYLVALPLIGLVLMLTAARERLTIAIEESTGTRKASAAAPADAPVPLSEPPPLSKTTQTETTTVKGTILDAQTNQPLPNATVLIVLTTVGTNTGPEGQFELTKVPLGSSLAVSYLGYESARMEVTKKNQVLRILLKKREQPLEELVVTGYPSSAISSAAADTLRPLQSGEEVYMVVEQMPEFPGGTTELFKYLAQNIRYPAEAREKRVQGKVFVSFTVSERGAIREPKVTKGLGAGIDEEALRVVLNMPAWKPAKQSGRPAAVQYLLPIQFLLEEEKVEENKEKRQGNTTRAINYKLDNAVDFMVPTRLPTNVPIGTSPVHPPKSNVTLIFKSQSTIKE
jgi:TonB family protein